MLYRRYQSARDAAWRTLIRYEVKGLPVDVEEIARGIGVPIEAAELPGKMAGRSIRQKGKWRIQVQKNLPFSRYRFAVAHELGHLILQHKILRLEDGTFTFEGLQNMGDVMCEAERDADTDADMFAIRLLAPACVLHSLQIQGAKSIGDACGLPEAAAMMRAERMQLLNARNVYFTHPLEKQLQKQFLPFIRERKLEQVPQTPFVPPLALPERKKEEPVVSIPLWVWIAAAAMALLLVFLLGRG